MKEFDYSIIKEHHGKYNKKMNKNSKITFEEHEIIGAICKILNVRLLGTIPKYRTKKKQEDAIT